jgi:hypothetical protein
MQNQQPQPSILSSYQNLTALDLTCCRHITDLGLEQIAQLPLLATLSLRHCRHLFWAVDTPSLSHLANLSTLTHLDIATNPLMTASHWQQLTTLRFVHSLDVTASRHLNDDSLQMLSSMTQLLSLNLSMSFVLVGPGLSHLRTLHQLQFLVLTDCRYLTEVSALSGLPALVGLDMRNCAALTDNQFRYLAPLPHLEALSLADCPSLSIETLRFVTTLPSLTELDITNCTFSPWHVDRVLAALCRPVLILGTPVEWPTLFCYQRRDDGSDPIPFSAVPPHFPPQTPREAVTWARYEQLNTPTSRELTAIDQ